MRSTKVVIIGAGSADFGPGMLGDVLANPEFRGSTLSLVDIDDERLGLVEALAQRMNQEWDAGLTIEAATDRRRALPEAEFVLVAVEVERMKRWRMDFEVALEYGLRQPFSENGGPANQRSASKPSSPMSISSIFAAPLLNICFVPNGTTKKAANTSTGRSTRRLPPLGEIMPSLIELPLMTKPGKNTGSPRSSPNGIAVTIGPNSTAQKLWSGAASSKPTSGGQMKKSGEVSCKSIPTPK